ncbi:hypothetical protein J2X45_000301 [Caulobacter sp. BE264]|uniref:hypothetical protein n=1 Tax=Caulobacter sp. BE264 TaxID=2817724 RepID=UPI002866F879|nr:hypothetical protein [Caulobacter sp. BE264]MDR7229238.1 hypothetical protein [Caulobacter sp. BE264]
MGWLLVWPVCAGAQDLRDIQARNAAAHALEDLRREAVQSQITASNAQERARTDVILRDLSAGVVTGPVVLRQTTAPPALDEATRLDLDFDASMDRLERLTQEALAQSNTRMRAIRPASEPKE